MDFLNINKENTLSIEIPVQYFENTHNITTLQKHLSNNLETIQGMWIKSNKEEREAIKSFAKHLVKYIDT